MCYIIKAFTTFYWVLQYCKAKVKQTDSITKGFLSAYLGLYWYIIILCLYHLLFIFKFFNEELFKRNHKCWWFYYASCWSSVLLRMICFSQSVLTKEQLLLRWRISQLLVWGWIMLSDWMSVTFRETNLLRTKICLILRCLNTRLDLSSLSLMKIRIFFW